MVKKINLGGKSRSVRFSINALIEFESITGLDITEPEDRVKMHKLKNIRALAFVGLKYGAKSENEPFDLTEESVGDLLDATTQNNVMEAFIDHNSSGEETGEEEGEKKRQDGEKLEP